MSDHNYYYEKTADIIFGRWKSQILYTGVKLGVFDCITSDVKSTSDIADELDLDHKLAYRLLRALSSMGFLKEEPDRTGFSITPQGKLLSKDHPQTLRGVILLEEGPEHYAIWKHLPAMIKNGKQNAFGHEFGCNIFEYRDKNLDYAQVFNQAMSSYSSAQTTWVLEALDKYDFSNVHHICDIGGGTGHLLGNLLIKYPHMKGTVLELESVINKKESLLASKLGVNGRCSYVSGDMFNSSNIQLPSADAYIMKMILHDWSDEECATILTNIHRSSSEHTRLFIAEHLIPGPNIPHFSKLFDIHMMCAASGRERTVDEYSSLLQQSGWKYVQTLHPHQQSGLVEVIEGRKS
jgi:predicted transcriptional regulator/ubiquinone/menaquinone biosynthesis C-methylase UbiE